MKVPFVDLKSNLTELRSDILAAVERVIDSGSVILGPETAMFEQEFASFCGADHCIGVGNGLEALSLCLRAADVGPEDEVIVPSQTFIASWLAASHVGAVPVPVDVDPRTYTLDPTLVEEAITSRTRAIMPVHLYGHSADMDPLLEIADRHGLFILEDAAQAHGAEYKGRRAGGLGHAAGFSFYPTKNLGALGDGGAITTSHPGLADRLRCLRNYGSNRKYYHDEIGFNTRLDEVQSAILRLKLSRLQKENDQRRMIAVQYREHLSSLEYVDLPTEEQWAKHVYHLFVIRTPERQRLIDRLESAQISPMIHYPITPGNTKAYAGPGLSSYAIGDNLAQTTLSLPMWPSMSPDQVAYVSNAIRSL